MPFAPRVRHRTIGTGRGPHIRCHTGMNSVAHHGISRWQDSTSVDALVQPDAEEPPCLCDLCVAPRCVGVDVVRPCQALCLECVRQAAGIGEHASPGVLVGRVMHQQVARLDLAGMRQE